MITVAAVQHDIVWEDPAANFAALAPRIEAAAGDGARLVVLAEMFSTGFSMRSDVIAEHPDGPTATFLLEQAARHGIWVGGSMPERTPGATLPTNTFVLASPQGVTHRYAKVHPFTYAREDEHYSRGATVATVDVEGVRVTPLICYDLRFVDLFWDAAADTDLYLVPANWPAARSWHWISLLRARAIENQAYVVGVNRVGTAGRLVYSGDSRIIDPLGEEIAVAEPGREQTLMAHVDPAHVASVREQFPFMADR